MRLEVNINVPGWLVYLFDHSAKWLVVKSLATGTDVIHRCFANKGLSAISGVQLLADLPCGFLYFDRCRLYSNE